MLLIILKPEFEQNILVKLVKKQIFLVILRQKSRK